MTITANVVSANPITNTATISGSDLIDTDLTNNTASATVTPQILHPTLTLSASPAGGQTYPGNVTLTAKLSGAFPLDGQTITFSANGSTHTETTGASGEATYTITNPSPAGYSFGATFAGDANNAPATAQDIAGYIVSKAMPDMNLTATGGDYSNNSITLTATVGAGVMLGQAYKPAPTGTITFKEGDATLATVPLDDSGVATYTVPSLIDTGNHTCSATYSGDDNFNANSASATVDVTPYLSVSPNELCHLFFIRNK